MDRDQERFYEDEELESRDNPQQPQNEEDIDDMRYFLELLKHIRAAINAGANVPLTGKKIVDADKCLMIIDDMEKNLPDAVQYGMQMYSERERIMGEAETRAMNRVSSAEMRANAALEKARDDAEQRVLDAENEARAILEDAQAARRLPAAGQRGGPADRGLQEHPPPPLRAGRGSRVSTHTA